MCVARSVPSPRIIPFAQIYYQNVRGVRTKIYELRQGISLHNYSIFSIREIWFTSNIRSEELGFHNYLVYRFDRVFTSSMSSRGGRVFLAAKRNLNSSHIETGFVAVKHIFIKIKLNNLFYFRMFSHST